MPQLTDQQLANTAAAAGWSGDDLVTAVAVALAESRGNSDAIGDVALQTAVWGPSVGLWQIRSLNAEKGKGTTRDQLANMSPVPNGQHAHEIWAQSGWRPWSTYLNQSYRLYVPRAQAVAATASGTGGGSGEGVTKSQNPLQAAGDALKIVGRAGAWITNPANVTRILQVALGGALIIGGAVVVARPAIESAADTVGKVVP